MSSNQTYFVKYRNNIVSIDTHFRGDKERKKILETVGDLIRACVKDRRYLGLPKKHGSLAVHLPEGFKKKRFDIAYFMSKDSQDNDTALNIECRLENLVVAKKKRNAVGEVVYEQVGQSSREPFILTCGVISDGAKMEFGLEQDSKVFKMYMEKGEILKDTEFGRHIIELVQELQARNNETIPFIVFEDSSGTGKTQTAFTMKAAGLPVFYIPVRNSSDSNQGIYEAFKSVSRFLNDCVQKDCKEFEDASVNEISNPEKPLFLYGFLYNFLKKVKGSVWARKRDEVTTLLDKMKACEKPVIFLDEFPNLYKPKNNSGPSNETELRFLRNLFRSLGLVVICSSTNSTATNLTTYGKISRKGTGPWCYVVPRFPNYDTLSGAFNSTTNPLVPILKNTRPWFAELVLKFCKREGPIALDVDFFDRLGTFVFEECKIRKVDDSRKNGFFLGQACLAFGASYHPKITSENRSGRHECLLVDHHFARLVEREMFSLEVGGSTGLSVGGKEWDPAMCYLNDPILSLVFLGGKEYSPFENVEGNEKVLWDYVGEASKRYRICFDNPIQKSNDGMMLEACAAATLTISSRVKGFRGVEFPTFLAFVKNHLRKGTNSSTEDIRFPSVTEAFGNVIIPCLSAPNVEWPEYLSGFGLNISTLKRTRNEDKIDFSAKLAIKCNCEGECKCALMTGECKDYGKNLPLKVIKKILKNIPLNSKIHLVFTNTLQERYFTKGRGFDGWISKPKRSVEQKEQLRSMLICKLPDNLLEKISGVPWPSNAGDIKSIVIFLPLSRNKE